MLLLLLTTTLLAGCSDDRAVAISREAADRQAAQNREMSQHNREVAAAHRQLAGVQEGVQKERQNLSGGWNNLEKERQQIARDRRTESLLTVLTPVVGTVAVIVAVLYFAGRLLSDARSPDVIDAELCKLLVTELASTEPRLFSSPNEPPPHQSFLPDLPEHLALESSPDTHGSSR